MINIREYTKKKETSQSRDLKKEIARHRLTVFYRILLAVIVIAGIIGIIYVQKRNQIYETYQVISQSSRAASENAIEKEFAGKILTYSKDGANCTDLKGNAVWNQTYEMQNPMVDICANTVAIGDYNGHTIYIMDTEGTKGEIDTGMPIRTFCISANGVVAVVLDDSPITWIALFNSNGEKLLDIKTTMQDYGYPIDVDISSNALLLGVSYLYVDSGELKTKVSFYNFGEVGQNQIDTLVSAYEYSDSVVPEIKFMNDSTIFALADNRLMIYKGNQIPTHQGEVILSEEIQSVFYNEKYIALIYLNAGGEAKYRLDLYTENCKLLKSIHFNLQYKDVVIKDDRVTIYNESECLIYTVDGVKKFEGKFKETMRTFIPTAKQEKYIGVTADNIQSIELR